MWVKKVKLREPCLNHRPAEGQSWRGSRFCPCLWCRNCHPRPRWGGPGIAAGRAVSKGGVRALGPTCKWLELCLPVCSLGVKGRRSLGLPSCPSPACSLGHAGSRAASHALARTHAPPCGRRLGSCGRRLTVCQNRLVCYSSLAYVFSLFKLDPSIFESLQKNV